MSRGRALGSAGILGPDATAPSAVVLWEGTTDPKTLKKWQKRKSPLPLPPMAYPSYQGEPIGDEFAPGGPRPIPWQSAAELGLSILPGSGEVMSARDSQRSGQQAWDRLMSGDIGGAASSYADSLAAALGAIPIVGAAARGIRGAVSAADAGGMAGRRAEYAAKRLEQMFGAGKFGPFKTVPTRINPMLSVLINPSDAQLLAYSKAMGGEAGPVPLRSFRDPRTGDRFYWHGEEAIHREIADRLGLEFYDEEGIWWPR